MIINDVFYFISAHELDMQKSLQLKLSDSQATYKQYIENYEMIKNEFLSLISVDNKTLFDYQMMYSDNGEFANASMKWLDDDKKEFLLQRTEQNLCLGWERMI